MTWQNGRELATYADSAKSVAYSYDASGMRTGKTVTKSSGATTAYTYVYENGLLLQMSRGARFYDFSYDANGRPLSIAYRSQAEATPIYYYYALNSRGDVIGLYNSSGNIAALYDYDAYGKLLSVKTATGISITAETDVAIVNPLRYRGYVYDTETGLYYLQTRYYDPTTCRFVNGDIMYSTGVGITGYNTYAYCNNNPIICSDNSGTRPIISTSVSNETPNEREASCAYMREKSLTVQYNVPLYDQGDYNLCWAYCQVMVEDYEAGIIRTPEEAKQAAISIAYSVYGSNYNQGGWPTNSVGYNGSQTPERVSGIYSLSDLYTRLKTYGPLYAFYEGYGNTDPHLVVVTGVSLCDGLIYTNNPHGVLGSQSYIEFMERYADGPTDRSCRFSMFIAYK